MNRWLPVVSLFMVLSLMFGCYSQTPKPVGYNYSTQHKMQSAQHWDILAEDVARQIRGTLERLNSIAQPVYVDPGCGAPLGPCQPHEEAPFTQGFRDLLLTHLVNQGITTVDEVEDGSLIVNNKVQVVHHRADREMRQLPRGLISTAATLLAGAVVVIRDLQEYGSPTGEAAAWAGTGLAGAILYDITGGMRSKKTHSEVIITTSVKDYNTYLMRKTDMYYINDADYWHYAAPPPTQVFEVRDS